MVYADTIVEKHKSKIQTTSTVKPDPRAQSQDPFQIEIDMPILEGQSRHSPSINVQEYPTCKSLLIMTVTASVTKPEEGGFFLTGLNLQNKHVDLRTVV